MTRIRTVLGFLWRLLDGVRRTLHLVLLLTLAGVVIGASHHSLPIVPAKAALVVHLDGRLVEQSSADPFARSVRAVSGHDGDSQVLLHDVVTAIRAAAKDARIPALVLETENLSGGGLTKFRIVADAIEAFRHSGKPVYAFGRYVSQDQYYLLAQADHAYLDPTGVVDVTGYSAQNLYFHDALDKLGVTVNVFKVGTYKSFTEPYTRSDQSPADREQTLAWLKPLWTAYRSDIERRRHLKDGTLDHYVDDAVALLQSTDGDAALLAQREGLVEALKTREEFDRELAGLVGEDATTHDFNAVDVDTYVDATASDREMRHPAGQVAVVVGSGEILMGEQGPGSIGGDTYAGLLRQARYDDDVKAVVLRIDSGGGSLMASEVIRQEVAALKAAGKPVIASFSSVAASGGYYIAMEADEIWAGATTITGSIGVFGLMPSFEHTLSKVGVAVDGVATSALAGQPDALRGLNAPTRAVLQLGVEHSYHQFVARVAAARHQDPQATEKLAEGRVWIGAEAQKLGLVDHLGDLDDAVRVAAERAKLPKDRYAVVWLEKDMSWKERVLRALDGSGEALADRIGLRTLPPLAARALGAIDRETRALAALNDPRRVYAYCGCDVR